MYRSIALVACNSGVCILHTQCRLYCGGKRALLASLSMTVLPLPPAAEKFKLTDQKVQFPSCNLVLFSLVNSRDAYIKSSLVFVMELKTQCMIMTGLRGISV